MNAKVNLTVGVDAEGILHCLYLGTDGGEAKQVYEEAVNGEHPEIVHVQLFIRPSHDRRRNVERPKVKVKRTRKAKPVEPEATKPTEPQAPEAPQNSETPQNADESFE